ncbi:MAG: T9SS type A sorting domain-containing protein [Bacteroidales bacterium]|nr:T9SS type A sorting domain-containing protein [Bacteroidales bacterium]MCF8457213.1 T9SS type A sorting domain-containing protein [Bacteroidales bacterium]
MRFLIIFNCALLFNYSYSQTIHFQYDPSGNRIHKEVLGNVPVVQVSGDTTICFGTGVSRSVNGNGVYHWSTGETTPFISVAPLQTTTYYVTVTGSNGCTKLDSSKVIVADLPVSSIITGDTIVYPDSTRVYSVAYHPDASYFWEATNGTVVSGNGSNVASILWGNAEGEVMVTEYSQAGCAGQPVSLEVHHLTQQCFDFNGGWNLMSFYIHPLNMATVNVFESIAGQLNYVKEELYFYAPGNPFGQLTNIADGQGYFVNVDNTLQFCQYGWLLQPQDVHIPLVAGWNLIGYPSSSPQAIQNGMAGIMPWLLKVKNSLSAFDPSYPPFYNTLNTLNPGDGFWVKVSANCTLTYPQPTKNLEIDENADYIWQPVIYPNSTVAYLKVGFCGNPVQDGDEIGAFVNGECRATGKIAIYQGNSYATLVINGVVPESATFRLFRNNTVYESNTVIQTNPGEDYAGIIELDFCDIVTDVYENTECKVYPPVPNPFSNTTTISFEMYTTSDINWTITGADGRQVFSKTLNQISPGLHTIEWNGCAENGTPCSSGVYYLRLTTKNSTQLIKLIYFR